MKSSTVTLRDSRPGAYRRHNHTCTAVQSGTSGAGIVALEAAGVSSRPCRRWTKSEVVQTLRRRHVKGPPLSHTWKDDKPLFGAAGAESGDWHSANRGLRSTMRPSVPHSVFGLEQHLEIRARQPGVRAKPLSKQIAQLVAVGRRPSSSRIARYASMPALAPWGMNSFSRSRAASSDRAGTPRGVEPVLPSATVSGPAIQHPLRQVTEGE